MLEAAVTIFANPVSLYRINSTKETICSFHVFGFGFLKKFFTIICFLLVAG